MGCNWFNQSECFVGFVTMMKYLTRAHLKRTWRHIKVTMECTTYAEFGNPRLNHQEINNSEPASCGLSCGQPAKPSRATFRFLSQYLLVNYLPILNNYILVHLDISWYILIFKWVYKYIYISYYILVCLDTSPPSAGPELHWGIQSRKAVRPGWGGTTGSGEGSGATLIPSCSKQAQAFSPGAGKNDGAVRNFDVKTLKNWRSKECIDPKVFQWIL